MSSGKQPPYAGALGTRSSARILQTADAAEQTADAAEAPTSPRDVVLRIHPASPWESARLRASRRRIAPGTPRLPHRLLTSRGPSDIATAHAALLQLTHTVRTHRVADIRARIRDDSYENALKLEVAVDRLLADLQPAPTLATR